MLMNEIYSFLFLFIVAGLGLISHYFLHRLDTIPILRIQEERHPGAFIGERAYQNLKALNDFGPKVVGSKANEELAVNYILDYVHDVKRNATRPEDIEIRHQIVSGHFKNNKWEMYYENLQNVIVKLQGEDDHALLINCHFDSVPGSPGASDDAVSCCVMMEILRVLSKNERPLRHSIVFLFNGAEEIGLNGAHGFITQHEWAQNCKALINLESTGSSGREMLFQSGPKHDWLIKMYRESVPKPFGQAIAEELFETGIIPSATDFEVFRDQASIPGLDFAYTKDGWRYHTRYDSINYIPLESVQHTGNNILELTKKIANSDELENPPEGTNAVYFDYLGFFFISYTKTIGMILNIVISVLVVGIPFVIQTKFKLENVGFVLTETILSFLTMVAGVLFSFAACFGLSQLMSAVDRTMTWYNNIFLSIGMYCGLAVLVQVLTYHCLQKRCCINTQKYKEVSMRRRVKISLNGVNLFWAIGTIGVTILGYRFVYISMVILLVSLCTYLLTFGMCKILHKTTSQSWIFMHLFGHMFSFLLICYAMFQLWYLFIPIVTKTYVDNPDFTLSLICALWTVTCLSYFIPLTLLVKYRAMLYASLVTFFGVSLILAFTSAGFPYSDSAIAPRLQRFNVINAKRTLYDPLRNILFQNGSVIIYMNDRNSHKTFKEAFGENGVRNWRGGPLCEDQLNCGYPAAYSLNNAVTVAYFDAMPNMEPTNFTLIKSQRSGSMVEVEFRVHLVTGLTNVVISPANGMTFYPDLASVNTRNMTQNGRMHFIIQYIHGKQLNTSKRVKFTLEGMPELSNVIATIAIQAVDSTFDYGPQNPEFQELMAKFPDYTFSYVRQADCNIYQIEAQ